MSQPSHSSPFTGYCSIACTRTGKREHITQKAPKTPVRSGEELLKSVQELATLRASLQTVKDDPQSENAALDLGVAIQVLQWVLDPADNSDLEAVILGASEE